jgi:hypothetical protein
VCVVNDQQQNIKSFFVIFDIVEIVILVFVVVSYGVHCVQFNLFLVCVVVNSHFVVYLPFQSSPFYSNEKNVKEFFVPCSRVFSLVCVFFLPFLSDVFLKSVPTAFLQTDIISISI